MPPLRAVQEEIQPLCEFFVDQLGRKNGIKKTISDSALSKLKEYSWPGNIRELRNVIAPAYVMSGRSAIIESDDINLKPIPRSNAMSELFREIVIDLVNSEKSLDDMQTEMEDRLFLALENFRNGNNLTQRALAQLIETSSVTYCNRRDRAMENLGKVDSSLRL